MTQPRHRPVRRFPEAEREIIVCEMDACPHCGQAMQVHREWHMKKTVQTLKGARFIAGRCKECVNVNCTHTGKRYYASGVLMLSLPHSTYGLDVLAMIGWRHEHDHRQLLEIQRELNEKGILVNERNVGRLYRQFLALLGAMSASVEQKLQATVKEHGGLIWAIDALQPEGTGTLLYVLYEVLSGTPVAANQMEHPDRKELCEWLKPYRDLGFPVMATLSDGEEAIVNALKTSWPDAPHQRCQSHFLGNLVEPLESYDTLLRKQMRADLGGLPAVVEFIEGVPAALDKVASETVPAVLERVVPETAPLFSQLPANRGIQS